MPALKVSRLATCVLAFGLLLAPVGCGNGGGNGTLGPVAVVPPQALVYATNPAVYTLGQAIPANTATHGGDAVTGYSVAPALPVGLTLSATTGSITGTPTVITATTSYTVTATNSGGSTTASLSITVNDQAPSTLAYAFPTATYTVGTPIPGNAPTHGGGAVTSYQVSPALPQGLSLNTTSGLISGTPTAAAAVATYTVTARNSGGQTTAALSMTVNDPPPVAPTFTSQPTAQSVIAPAPATFAAAASGTPEPTLQWQRSNDSGTTWVDLAGATASSFTTGATSTTDNGARFRVIATNSAASLTSTEVALTVASAAKAWQVPTRVGANIPGDTYNMQTAFDAAGNGFVVWQHTTDGSRNDIWANRYVVGTGWGTPTLIETDDTVSATNPRIGVDASGKALVVWEAQAGFTYSIWANTYTPGTGWGTASKLATPVGAQVGSPEVAMSANGTATVTWTAASGPTLSLMAIGFSGAGWGTAGALTTGVIGGAGSFGNVRMAADANGHCLVVWVQYDSSIFNVWAVPCSGGAATDIPVLIETDNTASASWLQVAMNASGTAIAVWQQSLATGFKVWANRYTPASGWGTSAIITTDTTPSISLPAYPKVDLDDLGNAVAGWTQSTGASSRLFASHQPVGGAWATAAEIRFNAFTFDFNMNGAGDLFGSWIQGTSLYASNGPVATPANSSLSWTSISAVVPTPISQPRITVDAQGRAMVVWMQADGGHNTVFASRFE